MNMSQATYLGPQPTIALVALSLGAEHPRPVDAGRPSGVERDAARHTPPAGRPAGARAARRGATAPHSPDFTDLVDEWGKQSFPASDPPANW